MKKLNWFSTIGISLIALALLLTRLKIQHNVECFVQGFSIGLGIVLIIKGFFVERKRTSMN